MSKRVSYLTQFGRTFRRSIHKQKKRLGYPTQKPLALLNRIITASSNPNDIVLDAFCGCGTALEAAEHLGRQWIGIDKSPTACRVMAKRLRERCGLREGEERIGVPARGLLSATCRGQKSSFARFRHSSLRTGRLLPSAERPTRPRWGIWESTGESFPCIRCPSQPGKKRRARRLAFDYMDDWYPIQVKQKDKAGRPDIDAFEAVMMRADRPKGFFVSFDFSSDALREISALFQANRKIHCSFHGAGNLGRSNRNEAGLGRHRVPFAHNGVEQVLKAHQGIDHARHHRGRQPVPALFRQSGSATRSCSRPGTSRTAASRFSSFFEKPRDSRVNRFIRVRIVRLCRSTCEVHIDRSSSSRIPNIPFRSVPTISGGA